MNLRFATIPYGKIIFCIQYDRLVFTHYLPSDYTIVFRTVHYRYDVQRCVRNIRI